MKYLRGYLTAAIFGALTFVLMQYGERFSTLVDMVYPYVIRTVQDYLATWSGQVDFCLWQLLAVALGVLIIASIVVMIALKWNPIQWFGWVLAVFSLIFLLHTLVFGLNYYAGDLADDLRLEIGDYSEEEFVEAICYYRDQANALAKQVKRDGSGSVAFDDFEKLAAQAGDGFHTLTYERSYPVFAGSVQPVKKLGWADMYTSMGITGFTFGLTGEAAVNPKAPATGLPFTMCHEMCHRMCIASERDANFGAFLACIENSDIQFRYSGYFMAYRYCLNALVTRYPGSVERVLRGVSAELDRDVKEYDAFYAANRSARNTKIADTVNDTYLKTSGETQGIASYDEVYHLLVNWHIEKIFLPTLVMTENPFDPYDTGKVDLTGIVNAR